MRFQKKMLAVRLLAFAALWLSVISYAGEARAGCGAVCDLVAAPISVEPTITCVDVHVVEHDCTCGVDIQFFNGCMTPLDFSRAKLDGCSADPRACDGIAPSSSNYKRVAARANGHLHSSFVFSENGVEHTVTVDAEVSSFEDVSCACRSPGSVSAPGHVGAYVLVMAGLSLLGFRRRARHTGSKLAAAVEDRSCVDAGEHGLGGG